MAAKILQLTYKMSVGLANLIQKYEPSNDDHGITRGILLHDLKTDIKQLVKQPGSRAFDSH